MNTVPPLLFTKVAHRVTAVLSLFRGIPLPQVTAQFGICRSDLYKFRRRALTALHHALADQPRGPKRPPTIGWPSLPNNGSPPSASAIPPGAQRTSSNAADLRRPVPGPFNGYGSA